MRLIVLLSIIRSLALLVRFEFERGASRALDHLKPHVLALDDVQASTGQTWIYTFNSCEARWFNQVYSGFDVTLRYAALC